MAETRNLLGGLFPTDMGGPCFFRHLLASVMSRLADETSPRFHRQSSVPSVIALEPREKRVRSKSLRWFHFDSQQVLGPISIFLAAFVAAHLEVAREFRRGLIWVGFRQRYPVFEQNVLLFVEFVILAKHDPEVPAFVAHSPVPVLRALYSQVI